MAKTINGSGGSGGLNLLKDVMLVQYLLNCVPVNQGGPTEELVVDGLAGPKTVQAIGQFQKERLGFADGLVDTNRQTMRELNKFDPYPEEPFNPVGGPGSKVQWKAQQKVSEGMYKGGSTTDVKTAG